MQFFYIPNSAVSDAFFNENLTSDKLRTDIGNL